MDPLLAIKNTIRNLENNNLYNDNQLNHLQFLLSKKKYRTSLLTIKQLIVDSTLEEKVKNEIISFLEINKLIY